MRPSRALRRLCLCFVVLTVILLGGGLAWALGNNSILSFMLLGSFVIHLGARPGRAEWLAVLVLAAVLRTLYAALVGFHPYFGSVLISCGSFLGLASLLVQLLQILRSRDGLRATR